MSDDQKIQEAIEKSKRKDWISAEDFAEGWQAHAEWARGQQEPFAYGCSDPESRNSVMSKAQFDNCLPKNRVKYDLPLYFTPPQQPATAQPVRLSEDEVNVFKTLAWGGAHIAPPSADQFAKFIQDAMLAKGAAQPAAIQEALDLISQVTAVDEDGENALIQAGQLLRGAAQPAVVQQSWSLDQEQAKFLADYILADPEEPTAVTLSVGFVKDDDGSVQHGLRLIDTEYPEEGAIILVESDQHQYTTSTVQQPTTPDEVVELKVGRRTYIMEWCKSLGPSFYFKNDKPYLPSQRAPIWKVFGEWMGENK